MRCAAAILLLLWPGAAPAGGPDHADDIASAAQITASAMAAAAVCGGAGIEIDQDTLTARIGNMGISQAERTGAAFTALVREDFRRTKGHMMSNPAEECYMMLSSYGPLADSSYQRGVLRLVKPSN